MRVETNKDRNYRKIDTVAYKLRKDEGRLMSKVTLDQSKCRKYDSWRKQAYDLLSKTLCDICGGGKELGLGVEPKKRGRRVHTEEGSRPMSQYTVIKP